MIIIGTVLASLVLLVCAALAGLCIYLSFAPNHNTEIRPIVIGSAFTVIMIAIGAGMVRIIMRVPAGSYFNVVGLVTLGLVGVMVKYGRR